MIFLVAAIICSLMVGRWFNTVKAVAMGREARAVVASRAQKAGMPPAQRELAERVTRTWEEVATRARLTVAGTTTEKSFVPASKGLSAVGHWEKKVVPTQVPPTIAAIRGTAVAVEIWVRIPQGMPPARFDQPEVFEAAWQVPATVDFPEPGFARIILRTAPNALERVWQYPVPAEQEIYATADEIGFAIDQDAQLVKISVLESSLLIGGLPGAGKSAALNAILASLSQVPNVALYGIDPKILELADWAPRFTRMATTDEEATAVLLELVAEMNRRYQKLAKAGKRKVTAADGQDFPALVLVVDELAEIISSGVTRDEKKEDDERATLLRRLLQKGRAAGIVVIAATQKPDSTSVPTSLRDLFGQRFGLMTANYASTEVIMGAFAPNAPAHEISGKGIGFLGTEKNGVQKVRVLWLPDDGRGWWARHTAHLRVPGRDEQEDAA